MTKLSQVVDQEIGIGISPSNICEDLLNILTGYSHSWFKLIKQLSKTDQSDEFSLIKSDCKKIAPNKQGEDLSRNLTISFLITIPILFYNGIIFQNLIFLIGILIALMLIFFFFKNYLKYFKIYSDEVFRAFYIYCLEKEKSNN